MSGTRDDKAQSRWPALEKKGGYPAGDKPVRQLRPPPAGMMGNKKIKKSA